MCSQLYLFKLKMGQLPRANCSGVSRDCKARNYNGSLSGRQVQLEKVKYYKQRILAKPSDVQQLPHYSTSYIIHMYFDPLSCIPIHTHTIIWWCIWWMPRTFRVARRIIHGCTAQWNNFVRLAPCNSQMALIIGFVHLSTYVIWLISIQPEL